MKSAIVYFSLSLRTKALSEEIEKYLKSEGFETDIFQLETKQTGSFLKNCSDAFTKKHAKLESMPQIEDSEIVFIGSPVWAFDITPAVRTFVENTGLKEKRVFIYTTYGSGKGKERAMESLSNLVVKSGGSVIGRGEVKGRKVKEESANFIGGIKKCLESYQLTKRPA